MSPTPVDVVTGMRLLLVEDCSDDAELLSLELIAAGLAFELRRVENAAHLREAVGTFAPHLVISDSNLPGFSGLEALLLVRELAPTTPFLFLSGDDDERVAVNALSHGAAGYISKQHLRRMPATITRLLGMPWRIA
jgi:DNA-binding response OmpR family regulator